MAGFALSWTLCISSFITLCVFLKTERHLFYTQVYPTFIHILLFCACDFFLILRKMF
jgi:hypothetical protein